MVLDLFCRMPEIIDQFEYMKILEEVMLSYGKEEMLLKWMFEQDKTHVSCSSGICFKTALFPR